MAFCINCGTQLTDEAKFCSECGHAVSLSKNSDPPKRDIVYEGKVYVCPQCGETVNSFELVCSACGHEMRSINSSGALYEFSQKIANSENIGAKEELIRNFYIPNTKEDITEFFILAAANIETDADCREAWAAKLEQTYQKAKLSFGSGTDFDYVEELYNRAKKLLKKKRVISATGSATGGIGRGISWVVCSIAGAIKAVLVLILNKIWELIKRTEVDIFIFFVITLILIGWAFLSESNEKVEHNKLESQLELLVEEVDSLIEQGEYDSARIKISQIVYDLDYSYKSREKWTGVRESLLELVSQKETSVAGVESVKVKNFTFDLPVYWEEEGSKIEYLQYYAEKDDSVVMLSIAYPEESDSSYDVTFEGLYADNENMVDAVAAMFTDGDVIAYEVVESNFGVKGILYRFTYTQKINLFSSVDGSGYCFCFPSEEDRRWFYVVLMCTDNVASDGYKDDYMRLLSSIRTN